MSFYADDEPLNSSFMSPSPFSFLGEWDGERQSTEPAPAHFGFMPVLHSTTAEFVATPGSGSEETPEQNRAKAQAPLAPSNLTPLKRQFSASAAPPAVTAVGTGLKGGFGYRKQLRSIKITYGFEPSYLSPPPRNDKYGDINVRVQCQRRARQCIHP